MDLLIITPTTYTSWIVWTGWPRPLSTVTSITFLRDSRLYARHRACKAMHRNWSPIQIIYRRFTSKVTRKTWKMRRRMCLKHFSTLESQTQTRLTTRQMSAFESRNTSAARKSNQKKSNWGSCPTRKRKWMSSRNWRRMPRPRIGF